MSIRWKLFKNKSFPTPGLFCMCHNQFLDWLPEKTAFNLIDEFDIPEEPWIEKKNVPNTLTKSVKDEKNLLNQRRKKKIKSKKIQTQYYQTYGRNF